MKYADKRGSPLVVIQGSDERRRRTEVTLKDLIEGTKAAGAIKDNKEWKESRPAQVSIKEADLVMEVREDPGPAYLSPVTPARKRAEEAPQAKLASVRPDEGQRHSASAGLCSSCRHPAR